MLELSPDFERKVLERFAPVLQQAADGASRAAVESWRDVIETSVPSGREYRDRDTGQRRRASAPGQAPADPEGAIRDSLHVSPSRRVQEDHHGAAYSESGIMPTLEFGGGNIAPRPSARPAHALAAERLRADLGQVLK